MNVRRQLLFDGRMLFGASAVLFGVIALLWQDADTWQTLIRLWRMPFGSVIGPLLMGVLIMGGIGLLLSRTLRAASLLLMGVFGVFSLTCLSVVLVKPRVFDAYDSFFEQFCLLCGAVALYAASFRRARSARLVTFARIGLGLSALSFTLAQIIFLQPTAGLVPKWLPPNQMFWAIATTVAFALAAVAILINIRSRPAARLMSAMIVIFGVLVWIPIVVKAPTTHFAWSELALTFLIAGASAAVANVL